MTTRRYSIEVGIEIDRGVDRIPFVTATVRYGNRIPCSFQVLIPTFELSQDKPLNTLLTRAVSVEIERIVDQDNEAHRMTP